MPLTRVQSLGRIHNKLYKEFITQTHKEFITQNPYPIMQKSLPKRLNLKGHNSVKIDFFIIKTPHAHYHYVHSKYAWFIH